MFSNNIAAIGMGKELVLILIGTSAGGVVAAGVFAFIAMIGIFPRLIGKTNTHCHILLYETVLILGGITGTVVDLFEFPIHWGGSLLLGTFGLCVGIFVGCLVMSLAETLKALPILNRRIHLAVGLQYVILSVGIGKMIGSFIYFACKMGL